MGVGVGVGGVRVRARVAPCLGAQEAASGGSVGGARGGLPDLRPVHVVN